MECAASNGIKQAVWQWRQFSMMMTIVNDNSCPCSLMVCRGRSFVVVPSRLLHCGCCIAVAPLVAPSWLLRRGCSVFCHGCSSAIIALQLFLSQLIPGDCSVAVDPSRCSVMTTLSSIEVILLQLLRYHMPAKKCCGCMQHLSNNGRHSGTRGFFNGGVKNTSSKSWSSRPRTGKIWQFAWQNTTNQQQQRNNTPGLDLSFAHCAPFLFLQFIVTRRRICQCTKSSIVADDNDKNSTWHMRVILWQLWFGGNAS